MKQNNEEEKCCGACCWMQYEDTDGWGFCALLDACNEVIGTVHCSDLCTVDGSFVSEEQKRHYIAVLIQANRYRRDNNVPGIYKMPNPTELGEAIDFAIKYLKTP